jgi:hypothetical protein
MATIEVRPQKNGKWAVGSERFEDRRSAIAHAGEVKEPADNVVLLRLDGSVHGELMHAESGGGATDVDVTPAGEEGSA